MHISTIPRVSITTPRATSIKEDPSQWGSPRTHRAYPRMQWISLSHRAHTHMLLKINRFFHQHTSQGDPHMHHLPYSPNLIIVIILGRNLSISISYLIPEVGATHLSLQMSLQWANSNSRAHNKIKLGHISSNLLIMLLPPRSPLRLPQMLSIIHSLRANSKMSVIMY